MGAGLAQMSISSTPKDLK
jgi:tetratricopeptide (TPR) repeat protein